MEKIRNRKKYGFTLIEVSLVLAVAGAIIVMVFIAVPAVQRQARDATRRDDVLEVVSAIKSYQQNNRGALPTDADRIYNYLRTHDKDNFKDPDGTKYELVMSPCSNSGCAAGDSFDHIIYIYTGASCGEESAKTSNNPRKAAVLYKTEGAGVYCAET